MKRVEFIINPISGTVSKAGIPEAIDEYLDKSKYSYEIVIMRVGNLIGRHLKLNTVFV